MKVKAETETLKQRVVVIEFAEQLFV